MTAWQEHADALTDRLTTAGDLSDSAWQAAFRTVPRHVFVPDVALAAAYADGPIVTQTRAAHDFTGTAIELPTSSASAPAVVAVMLDRLNIADGIRVLEIGTGTGYNAALLSHRLGSDNVYSIDLDPILVDTARTALNGVGYTPALLAGDGDKGFPDVAPFDRIIATCSVTHIPPAWIRQLAPGGRIVAPLHGEGWALAVLDKTAPDEVNGRIDREQASFMPLRSDVNNPLTEGQALGYDGRGAAHHGDTGSDPNQLADLYLNADLGLFLHLHLPGLVVGQFEQADQTWVTLTTAAGNAQARLRPDGDRWPVAQRDHRLWDTAEHALASWDRLGQPDRTRFGITATDNAAHQYVWLDNPDSQFTWPLPI